MRRRPPSTEFHGGETGSRGAEIGHCTAPKDSAFVEVALRDAQIPDLRLRVFPSARKVSYLLYPHLRRRHRVKLGVYCPPDLGLAAARSKARRILASVTQGANPAEEAAEARRTDDVRSLYREFEREVVRRLPPKTQLNWKGTSKRFLAEIGHLPRHRD